MKNLKKANKMSRLNKRIVFIIILTTFIKSVLSICSPGDRKKILNSRYVVK